jgi:hypothetical protein
VDQDQDTARVSSDLQYLVGLAQEAYIWGYPLVQTGEYLRIGKSKNQPTNQIVLGPTILSEAYAPCIDVLYGFIFLDLTREPQVLSVPDTRGRHYSFQFIDTFGNVFAYVGSRATGTKAGTFVIVGPKCEVSPQGMKTVVCPTNEVLVNIRTFVADEEDLVAANALTKEYALCALRDHPNGLRYPTVSTVPLYEIFPILRFGPLGEKYFDVLGDRLALKPLPPHEELSLKKFAVLGLDAGQHPTLSADKLLSQALREAIPLAERRLESCNFATPVNGWEVIYGITREIKDTQLRAFVNRFGCGYHTAEEALYFHCRVGPDNRRLNGANKYRLRFAKDNLPPVEAFWSLSLMDLDLIPVRNPINRFSIAGHTKGLVYGTDGSLEILIQPERPSSGTSNWLPSAQGDFFVTLRLYEPKKSAIDRTYNPPQLRIE